MTPVLRVPRSRGALNGLLLVLLGAWGALIPFIGPSFHYAFTPDIAWTYTTGRLWLEILPGAATALGGLILLGSAIRPVAMFGAGLSAAAGAWFAVSSVLHPLWAANMTSLTPGVPAGDSTLLRVTEQIGFFTGLGVVIVFLAAVALGRLAVIATRDALLAQEAAALQAAPAAAPDASAPADGSATTTGRHRSLIRVGGRNTPPPPAE
jgi:hypothetical protein